MRTNRVGATRRLVGSAVMAALLASFTPAPLLAGTLECPEHHTPSTAPSIEAGGCDDGQHSRCAVMVWCHATSPAMAAPMGASIELWSAHVAMPARPAPLIGLLGRGPPTPPPNS